MANIQSQYFYASMVIQINIDTLSIPPILLLKSSKHIFKKKNLKGAIDGAYKIRFKSKRKLC